ncbi:RDD family protein [Nitrospirillum iridis]|uniref:Putative RDD family membrane protein YckC n=1 Tax=Nitrospirillum iridis TaxID=765888 RepID=A0A7X0EDS5_9PROT|nr:RDD family protein [Nitrospirillum iridis]MBB6252360.1 putative RDD family membrane protein YckC [Nitrospirillum iridis]
MSADATAPAAILPDSIAPGWTYGGFWRRALAAIIDGLILFVASLTASVVFGYPLAPGVGDTASPPDIGTLPTAAIVNLALYLSYHTLFVASGMRATPGKRFMNLVVALPDGGRISPGLAFARIGVQELISVPLVLLQPLAKTAPLLYGGVALALCAALLVNYLMVAFTEQKTAGHDRICGTRVFKTPDSDV